jgi:hypothetical protein
MPDTKKIIKYEKEQQETLNKLLIILNYNYDLSFTLNELDNNKELQTNILLLLEDIKKYYPSSNCTAATNKICKRPYMSIIRYILKFHNKKLYTNELCLSQENKKYVKTKKYQII